MIFPILRFVFSRAPIESAPDTAKFSEFDRNEAGFMGYYQQHVRPLRQKLEESRLKGLRSIRKHFFRLVPITLILSVFLLTVIIMEPKGDEPLALVGTVIFGLPAGVLWFLVLAPPVGAWLWLLLIAGSYGVGVRLAVLPKLARFFGDEWKFRAHGGFDQNILLAAGITPEFNTIEDENLLTGRHQGAEIQIAELKLIRKREASDTKRRRETMAFWGVGVSIQVRRKFTGKTIGLKDKGRLNWLRKKGGSLKQVVFDNEDFESEFEVFSSDPKEAHFLVNDKFIPLLMELSESFRNSSGEDCSLRFSFYNNKLLILIDSRAKLFYPPSIFEPALREQEFKQYLHQIGTVRRIVEETDVDRYRRS